MTGNCSRREAGRYFVVKFAFMDQRIVYLSSLPAEIAHLVEHQLPKLRVAGSSPVFRSIVPVYDLHRFLIYRQV